MGEGASGMEMSSSESATVAGAGAGGEGEEGEHKGKGGSTASFRGWDFFFGFDIRVGVSGTRSKFASGCLRFLLEALGSESASCFRFFVLCDLLCSTSKKGEGWKGEASTSIEFLKAREMCNDCSGI